MNFFETIYKTLKIIRLPAIILTGLMLTGGYSFMLLASLKTVMLFGLLTAIAILSGLFSELIMFPLLLQRFDRN